ncbi:MAG: hypothetical protein K2I59_00110, partial [Alistipes sp.]|nr:hypothetical protein [Alistipes sp.]
MAIRAAAFRARHFTAGRRQTKNSSRKKILPEAGRSGRQIIAFNFSISLFLSIFALWKTIKTRYHDAGRTFQETGRPLQGVRIRIPVERDLR